MLNRYYFSTAGAYGPSTPSLVGPIPFLYPPFPLASEMLHLPGNEKQHDSSQVSASPSNDDLKRPQSPSPSNDDPKRRKIFVDLTTTEEKNPKNGRQGGGVGAKRRGQQSKGIKKEDNEEIAEIIVPRRGRKKVN